MEESRTQPLPAASAASTLPSPSKSSPAEEQQPQLQTASEDTAKSQPKSQPKGEDNTTINKNQNQNKKPNKMPPKPPPTHFLCIPLVTASSRSQLTRSLAAFREEVTAPGNPSSSAYGALPVPEEAIRPVGTIHLTLGVMSFLEPRESKGVKTGRGGGGQGQAGQVGGSSGRDGPQEDNGRRDRSRSRSGSRSGSEEQGPPSGSGSLSGLRKLEEAKALLKSLKLSEIWQEVLRQSQTRATAVPMPRDSNGGGAPIAIGTAEEKGEGVEAGMGTVIREVPPQLQSETGKKEEEEDLKITLKGLHSMQSPSKAAVLYAPPVDPLGHLQRFCERVKAEFVQKELMMEEGGRPLLLHATVVNTIYVKGGRGRGQQQQQQQGGGNRGGGRGGKKGHHGHRGGGNKRERLTIDAREILERYEEYTWMEDVKVEKVAICKMGAKKEMVDGVVVDEAYEVEEDVEF
ncbi:AKAP7 2'5' RNA ligase-like domain-containing protein [Neurospora tetraspora]|uniref:AKAP7 2'5' RNA ligase-like domain-containing protein n=1 Tax=Neurospora tetraspora TaxID=94610 RepID=A0AAE0JGB2_9PEZI|nr:AKAP7 2'5' RNA ligase-like domain-containing protein [Neurospora tetraspora]